MNDLARWKRERDARNFQEKATSYGYTPPPDSPFKADSDQVSYNTEMIKQGYASILKLLRENINPVDLKDIINRRILEINGYIAAGGEVKPKYISDLKAFIDRLRGTTVNSSIYALDEHLREYLQPAVTEQTAKGPDLLGSSPEPAGYAAAQLASPSPAGLDAGPAASQLQSDPLDPLLDRPPFANPDGSVNVGGSRRRRRRSRRR